jgi:hypothetical protein
MLPKNYLNVIKYKLLNNTFFDLNDKNYTDSDPSNINEILSKISSDNESFADIIPTDIPKMIIPTDAQGILVAGKKGKTRRKVHKKTRRKVHKKTRRKVHKKTRRKFN